MRNIIAPIITVVALSGCNAARETYYSHTFDGGDKNVAGVSVDAKQRFVWMPVQNVRTLKGQENAEYTYEVTKRPVVCAEPSPDAVSAFAASISANLSANFKGVDADAGFARSISETVQKMSERTEMIQVLRDGYYRACEAYGNGMMGEFGYALLLNQLDNVILRFAALNALAQQRPLPENAADRAKLAAVAPAQEGLSIAKQSVADARVRLNELEEKATQAKVADDAAQRDKAAALKVLSARLAAVEKVKNGTAEERDKANEALIAADRDAAAATQWKEQTAGVLAIATERVTKATASLSTAEGQVTTALAALANAQKEAASVQPATSNPAAITGMIEVVKTLESNSGQPDSTSKGACLMWLSQHLEIKAGNPGDQRNIYGQRPDEPAIASYCKKIVAINKS